MTVGDMQPDAARSTESEPAETVIHLQGVEKVYEVYHRPPDRLKQMLFGHRRKFYDEYWALQNINLEIKRGETVGLIGRNGAGKSTLLKLICGTLRPSAGTVQVQGRIAALLELGFGFNPEFSGRENVYLSASILGLTRAQVTERFDSIADFADIGDFIDQPVKLYSSGMYARLAFAVAAHVDADVLIVDEILAVGDAAFGQKCMRFIRKFKEHGTLLFVSHEVGSVINLCDRAVWIDNGTIRAEGIAKDVCRDYSASLLYEKNANTFKIGGNRSARMEPAAPVEDVRAQLLKNSVHRNDIVLYEFDPDTPWFGERGATIQDVRLLNQGGAPLASLEGGETVILEVECQADQAIAQPIVGFFVKDKLGQTLFGDNTFLTHGEALMMVPAGQRFVASFQFQLPYLPTGDYAVTTAIAEGTQHDHRQHHWLDEALFFKVTASHVTRGLVGVPMQAIEMHLVTAADATNAAASAAREQSEVKLG